MDSVFLTICNLSLTATWVVLAVLLVRLVWKKAPKWLHCLLWGAVGLRLILPFFPESTVSLIPSAAPLPGNIAMMTTPAIDSGFEVIDKVVNPILSDSLSPAVGASVNPMQIVLAIATLVWGLGVVAMLVYGVISYLRVWRRVRPSLSDGNGVYYCDNVDTPFILGVIRPRIYLPSGLPPEQAAFVIAHERAHLKRKDTLWKPLGFLLLAVYWFNPVLWVAYRLLCRDIEMACDEKVIRQMDREQKKGYSEALVACSVHRRMILLCPLAFGEVGVKDRIRSVLHYKKPAFWLILTAILAGVIVAVCFLTNPAGITILGIDEPAYAYFDLEEIEEITFMTDSYRTTEAFDEGMKKELLSIRLRKKPLSLSRSEDREAVYTLILDHRTKIAFDGDCSQLWINDGVKPSYSYAVKDPASVQNWLRQYIPALYMTRAAQVGNVKIVGLYSQTDMADVYAQFGGARYEGGQLCIDVIWENPTGKDLTVGPDFEMYRYEGDALVKLEHRGVWLSYETVMVGERAEYSYPITRHYDLESPGKYRLSVHGAHIDFIYSTLEGFSGKYDNGGNWLFATVMGVTDGYVLVEPFVGTWERESADVLLVSKSTVGSEPFPKLREDDIIIVEYDGLLLNSSPAQLPTVYRVFLYDSSIHHGVYDSVVYDIDRDGKDEVCQVNMGFTSGIFTFSLSAREPGQDVPEYHTGFYYPDWMDLQFVRSPLGVLRLQGEGQHAVVHTFDIRIRDGNFVLLEDGEELKGQPMDPSFCEVIYP